MGPLREALRQGIEITKLKKEDMRPVNLQVIFQAWEKQMSDAVKKTKKKELKAVAYLLVISHGSIFNMLFYTGL